MKPFNMKLSNRDREKLEAHRIRLGFRYHAEVVRYLINAETLGDIVARLACLPGETADQFVFRTQSPEKVLKHPR